MCFHRPYCDVQVLYIVSNSTRKSEAALLQDNDLAYRFYRRFENAAYVGYCYIDTI
jgi:hypothetical protein